MKSTIILLLFVIIASSSASPFRYLSRNNDQSIDLNSSENVQEVIHKMKGQMVLFAFKGLLQDIAMRGIAEKIDSIDERLSTLEGKMGMTTSTSEKSIDSSEEIEQQRQIIASSTQVQDDINNNNNNDYKQDLVINFGSKVVPEMQKDFNGNAFNQIENEDKGTEIRYY